MVFSQTSLKTQTVLKVVKLDHLKTEKDQQAYGVTGAVTRIDGYSSTPQASPAATNSFTEVSLKSEPLYSEMLHDSDFEFFQELDPLYYDPAKEEVAQTIDSLKNTEEKALNIDTPHNTFPPQGWEKFVDVNSSLPQTSFYNITPNGPLSPNDNFVQFDNMFSLSGNDKGETNLNSEETFLDIINMPMVIGDLASETVTDMDSWKTTEQVEWTNTPDIHYNFIYTNTLNPDSFINTDDSVDLNFGSAPPSKLETNESGLKCDVSSELSFGAMQNASMRKRSDGLSLDVSARAPAWPGDISTPVILSQVISLEKEATEILDPPDPWQAENQPTTELYSLKTSPKVDYEPITPKSEYLAGSDNDDSKSSAGKRRRHDSEESDETYTPYVEESPRKNKRRKPSVPIDVIALERALESQPKARRGRPPKRRESTVSSVCSVDDNSSSASTPTYKYRELRDKNNEASKRSRMNRKLKERQMEILASELEERNNKLRAEANILEDLTKKMRDQLMSAMLKK